MQPRRAPRPFLRHPGTRRIVSVVRGTLGKTSPVEFDGYAYVLLAAQERRQHALDLRVARSWIDAGASYVCSWGRVAEEIEDIFDHASFLEEVGPPVPFTFMTTSHKQSIEEAMWFALYCAAPPDDLNRDLNRVVLLLDTPGLQLRCTEWVRRNFA